MGIPRRIHQTWKTRYVPTHLGEYVRSWRREHPDWAYHFWTDELAVRFVHRYHRWFLRCFEGYANDVMRADALRYLLLFEFGGVYADLDYECYRSFLPLTCGTDLLLAWEWSGVPDQATGQATALHVDVLREWAQTDNTLGNAVIASCAGHPLWLAMLHRMMREHPGPISQPNRAIWHLTGPAFLTRVLLENIRVHWRVRLLDQSVLYPIPWHPPVVNDGYRASDFPLAFGAHHWAGTWWQPQPMDTRPVIVVDSKELLQKVEVPLR